MAKKWTPAEEKFLLDNYGKVPMAELADRFGVTRKAISAKMDKLRQAHGIDPVGARERAIVARHPGNSAQQMGRRGHRHSRESIVVWRACDAGRAHTSSATRTQHAYRP